MAKKIGLSVLVLLVSFCLGLSVIAMAGVLVIVF